MSALVQKRRVGRHGLVDAMPPGWHTARDLADRLGIARDSASMLLRRALRAGLVERRTVRPELKGRFAWRRT